MNVLAYKVHASSSHACNFQPDNILVNEPSNHCSRWTTTTLGEQFITLELESPSLLQVVTFGKCHKSMFNLKEFKVFAGLRESHMVEVLHSCLRNHNEQESFAVRQHVDAAETVPLPCRFVRIVPQSNWSRNAANYSLWFVELKGVCDDAVVAKAAEDYEAHCESLAIRLCLKHLRRTGLQEAFDSILSKKKNVALEDPLLTSLYDSVVRHGDYNKADEILRFAFERSLFDEHIQACTYKPSWRRLEAPGPAPGMRGGHQMCIDVSEDNTSGSLYLYGGWDGEAELSDFWRYDVASQAWTCISEHTEKEGGPGPRSCHKLCIDSSKKRIYTLGRYVDPDEEPVSPDFYSYDIEAGKWILISDDTERDGGPKLMYDHQMCMDCKEQCIYVFGGRTISRYERNSYSGLYCYDVRRQSWKLLRSDENSPTWAQGAHLQSRIGHSMLFFEERRQLVIFAGQRNKDYLSDFYVYDIDSDCVKEISRDSKRQGGPFAGFTQRATIDNDSQELFILSGLMKEQNNATETVTNSFWSYNMAKKAWRRIYQNDNTDATYWSKMKDQEPMPRYAHQVVYNNVTKLHYLFGGNPGEPANPYRRLDDFWELSLAKPTREAILLQAQFRLRKQKFLELCTGPPAEALAYLRQSVAEVVNHDNARESDEYRKLVLNLCKGNVPAAPDRTEIVAQRADLLEEIFEYFPESMKPPSGNLVDLVME